MARRFDTSDDERETRLTQQRDYAAQLQEQVRVKQEQHEQEKARRRHEQQRERELVDALARQTQAHRPPPSLQTGAPPQQQQQQTCAPSPVRSPQRVQQPWLQQPALEREVPHAGALLAGSPQKLTMGDPTSVFNAGGSSFAFGTYSGGGGGASALMQSPLVATFMAGPSIFDSLLQCEPNHELTNQIESLQSLRVEIEVSWRQRRAALQTLISKPTFIIVPSPTASASIPLSFDKKVLANSNIPIFGSLAPNVQVYTSTKHQLDQDIDLSSSHCEPDEPELMCPSHAHGLLGESVLIPISPAKHSATVSIAQRPVPSSPPRSNSAVHRRLAAATTAAASAHNIVASTVLRHDTKLVHFDQ